MKKPKTRDLLMEIVTGESRYSFLEYAELEQTKSFRLRRILGYLTVQVDPFAGEVIVRRVPPELQKLHQKQLADRITKNIISALNEKMK